MFYDVTDRETFNELTSQINYLVSTINEVKIFLVGNKLDLKHIQVIENTTISDFARKNQLNFMEISCLDGKNVDKSFTVFMKQIAIDVLAHEASKK